LDIYNFPELHGKRKTIFDIDPLTTQGIAVVKSGSLLACPTRDGRINIIDCNSAVIGSLLCKIFCPTKTHLIRFLDKSRVPFRALDVRSNPSYRTKSG
jgi:hypothetical protein